MCLQTTIQHIKPKHTDQRTANLPKYVLLALRYVTSRLIWLQRRVGQKPPIVAPSTKSSTYVVPIAKKDTSTQPKEEAEETKKDVFSAARNKNTQLQAGKSAEKPAKKGYVTLMI